MEGGKRLQVARGFRTKASAAGELSGSPSAGVPVSPAAAAAAAASCEGGPSGASLAFEATR